MKYALVLWFLVLSPTITMFIFLSSMNIPFNFPTFSLCINLQLFMCHARCYLADFLFMRKTISPGFLV